MQKESTRNITESCHTGLNLLKMKLEEFIVPLGNTFLELNDEGVISKNSETERNQFLSAAVWISVLSLL